MSISTPFSALRILFIIMMDVPALGSMEIIDVKTIFSGFVWQK